MSSHLTNSHVKTMQADRCPGSTSSLPAESGDRHSKASVADSAVWMAHTTKHMWLIQLYRGHLQQNTCCWFSCMEDTHNQTRSWLSYMHYTSNRLYVADSAVEMTHPIKTYVADSAVWMTHTTKHMSLIQLYGWHTQQNCCCCLNFIDEISSCGKMYVIAGKSSHVTKEIWHISIYHGFILIGHVHPKIVLIYAHFTNMFSEELYKNTHWLLMAIYHAPPC